MAEPAVEDAPVIRRPKKKLIVIGGAVLALALALGGGAVAFLKHRAAQAAAAADDDAAPEVAGKGHADPKNAPIYLPLDPFVVNLADKDSDRYAQVGITLELDSGVSADQIKAYMPAIRNAILLSLANKTSKELLNREGKEQLAQEIMREAVRPMGIEIADPQPVTIVPAVAVMAAASGVADAASAAASGVASAASGAAAASAPTSGVVLAVADSKPKPKRRLDVRNPIQHVHFSSFIIQ
jgi:flagellar FliL protein